jgi:hypothetical protein
MLHLTNGCTEKTVSAFFLAVIVCSYDVIGTDVLIAAWMGSSGYPPTHMPPGPSDPVRDPLF